MQKEKQNIATAVSNTLSDVTSSVPNLVVKKLENKLESMVKQAIIMVTMPATETSAPISAEMVGHAEPKRESGKPRLIKAKYTIAIKNANIINPTQTIAKALSHQTAPLSTGVRFFVQLLFSRIFPARKKGERFSATAARSLPQCRLFWKFVATKPAPEKLKQTASVAHAIFNVFCETIYKKSRPNCWQRSGKFALFALLPILA